MSEVNAKTILASCFQNINNRSGKLTIENVDAEVINHSCLQILQCRREGIETNEMGIIEAFTTAATELIPQYTKERSAHAFVGVMANCQWEGMWDHLRNYFQKTHGISIDGVESENLTFYSSKHKRYENGNLVSESEVPRVVNLSFTNGRNEVMVSIEPSLSPKPGVISKRAENVSVYNGTDPDYRFTIEFDEYEEIAGFILELVDRGVKIVYFE
jgi:hypothetical protein